MASFDDLPDEFEGIDFDAIPDLAVPSSVVTQVTPESTIDALYSFDDDHYNDDFFAQLDALEQQSYDYDVRAS
jgi:hypothetical protein